MLSIMRALVCVLLLPAALAAQSVERPVRAVTDPGVVTTRQAITPAGVPTVFQGRVYGVAFGKDASEIWVLHASQLYRLAWRENRVLSVAAHGGAPGLQAIRYDPASGAALLAAAQRTQGQPPRVLLARQTGAAVETIATELGEHIAGALAVGGGRAVVPLIFNNQIAVIELASGKALGKVPTEIAPFGAVMNQAGTVAYVSNWGGRRPTPKDLTAPTGLAPTADRVVVDARGIASTGTVIRLDVVAMKTTHTIPVELHPTALAWDEGAGRLYVANTNQDSVSVIDTRENKVLRAIPLQPFAQRVAGIAPTALALASDGRKLFVACGGINAVAQVDTASGRIDGLIPTAWYPNGLALSPDGKFLAVSALLGAGSGWRDAPGKRFVHAYRGSVAVLELPDAAQLAAYTTAVAENNHLPLTAPAAPSGKAAAPKAVPVRSGDPSLIEHVVYIVKENRTYDQVFGDLGRGDGDPSLAIYGREITPNHRALALRYVVLDNFYASGAVSADGHQWLTQAFVVDYLERAFAGWPRSYPYAGGDPLAYAASGFLWDHAARHGKSVRIYGEYADPRYRPPQASWADFYRDLENDPPHITVEARSQVEPLNRYLDRRYPPFHMGIPDQWRVRQFLREFREFERTGNLPNLLILMLPADHGASTRPGFPTPRAMVADNDLALGEIVEAVSHSRFWPRSVILVTEDDAQNGVDHVDGHRTVALLIGPHVRRGGIVDSTAYNHVNLVRTLEEILGLPPMNKFDAAAHSMRPLFTFRPDPAPYQALPNKLPLEEMNPPLRSLKGPALQAAMDSLAMNFSEPDDIPEDRLNRILWHTARGWEAPYPGVRHRTH